MNEENRINLLIIDDEKIIRDEIKDFFKDYSYNIYEADKPSVAFNILKKETIDIIILDIKLPEMDGIEVLKKIKLENEDIEVIMITGHGESEVMFDAMKQGAFDFFYKPISILEVMHSIERTNKYISLNNKFKKLEDNYNIINNNYKRTFDNIIGESEAIKSVIDLTLKAAKSPDSSVLITGESGSGKELIAKALHSASNRASNLFYPVNCSAIPETLIESEFFGHMKGTFTGAIEDKKGVFEAANGGTVFLDEIGDMPIITQAKLLRVLEEKKIKRIGSNREIFVDVRVVAATNMDLNEMIEKKQFRSDLYYRLNTVEIFIPPLRERKEDIPLLFTHYVNFFSKKLNKKFKNIDDKIIDILKLYNFPGNIRELINIIERAIIICDDDFLGVEHFSTLNINNKSNTGNLNNNSIDIHTLENLNLNIINNLEKEIILEALKRTKNNKSKASEILGVSRFALDRKLKKYNFD